MKPLPATLPAASLSPARSARADLLELTKPRITLMVVLTALVGLMAARGFAVPLSLVVGTVLGTGLLAAGASTLNMALEKDLDRQMDRTASRPIPAGRVELDVALSFGVTLAFLGTALLWALTNGLTTILGVVTLLTYVALYTPMKRWTPWATHFGAIPGALPVLMGWTAGTARVDAAGWMLFGVLFCWQLPHFFAIAWLYRDQYRKAGYRLIVSVDPHGHRLALETMAFSCGLVLISLSPPLLRLSGWVYGVGAGLAGVLFVHQCLRFARTRDRVTARRAMLASVIYLPVVMVLVLVGRWFHAAAL